MNDPNQNDGYPVIIRFRKAGLMRFVGHLDWQAMQQAMYIRAGFRIVMGDGPTKKLRMKTSPPTPVGVESECELTYLLLKELIYPMEIGRRLSGECPEGIGIMKVQDAKFVPRKNPFAPIEASEYTLEVAKEAGGAVSGLLESMKDDPVPEGLDEKVKKQVWAKILEIEREDGNFKLLVKQGEGDTFHGARCAEFLMDSLGLADYPVFRKANYLRLKPSKRVLFR